MSRLPIYQLENALVHKLKEFSRLILQAPTGSGKSTQVPQILLDHGFLANGEVVVLQPRRLATRMLAARVAEERGVTLGDEVGYQIRFDKVASARTKIRFVTEGVLLRQLLNDPTLKNIAVIIFDEFHERHLYGDISLARALHLQESARPDLKLIVMSATLDTHQIANYLAPDCYTLQSEGRTFPVEIEYLPKPFRPEDYPVWEVANDELSRLAATTEGDALIFMPGAYEIGRTVQAIRDSRVGRDFIVLPLHGELPVADQDAALRRYGQRKVVVATNVAETSLTIDGVRLVIDSGLARIARFDPHRGINTLLVEKISRASSDQRAGRAGRTSPGRCVRLWTELEHEARAPQELPEIKRLDLAEVVLTLKASGVENVREFRWLESPSLTAIDRAETLLRDLGALDEKSGAISEMGRRMLAFPMHPRYARMLIEADRRKCVRAIALIAALSQGRSLLRRSENPQMTRDREDILGEKEVSDFLILMRAFRFAEQSRYNPQKCRQLGINGPAARETAATFEQFLKLAKNEKLAVSEDSPDEGAIQRCVLAGFADQLAKRCDESTLRCDLVHARRGVLARESVVRHSDLFVAADVREVQIKGELTVLLNIATAIEESWLRELYPDAFLDESVAFFDKLQKRIRSRSVTLFRDLVISESLSDKVSLDAAAQILAKMALSGEIPLKSWDAAVEQWIVRLNRLREWMPELELPALANDDRLALIEQICHGATNARDVKERSVWPTVKSWLSPMQQSLLDKFAPERIELPNGKRWKILYDAQAAPTISARIQELYGVEGSLLIASARVPLVISVLAPNHRPIQVTQNLSTFWRESYPKLKLELQRKYPKHEWR